MSLLAFHSEAQETKNIEISKFTLESGKDKVLINWSTTNGNDVNYFEIEKSDDGKHFRTFALVMGADPTKDGNQFGYFDTKSKKSKTAYYRLKHVDQNGYLQYSDVRSI